MVTLDSSESLRSSPALSFHCRMPLELDWVWLDVGNTKVTDLERWGEHGTLKCTTSRHGLVQVQCGAQLSLEYIGDYVLDGWDAGCPSN